MKWTDHEGIECETGMIAVTVDLDRITPELLVEQLNQIEGVAAAWEDENSDH